MTEDKVTRCSVCGVVLSEEDRQKSFGTIRPMCPKHLDEFRQFVVQNERSREKTPAE